jgi:uncharacterized PurR-regulated membrane protein YhhQ (DUF165 family)
MQPTAFVSATARNYHPAFNSRVSMTSNSRPLRRWPLFPVFAMASVVVLSNWAVQYPINAWLTWGAFTYPVVFLVTDLTNRTLGPAMARRVAWIGFAIAVGVSLLLAPWRIALASGTAFIAAQVLDIAAFNRLRRQSWWQAPLIGSIVASVLDTALFFFLAFYGSGLDWLSLAAGDLGVKWAMAVLLLAPYRALIPRLRVWQDEVPASAVQGGRA